MICGDALRSTTKFVAFAPTLNLSSFFCLRFFWYSLSFASCSFLFKDVDEPVKPNLLNFSRPREVTPCCPLCLKMG